MQKKVIHSSGKKRRGARSDVAARHVASSHVASSHVASTDGAPGARRLDNKAIVQFAPNFTVYALPSNSVCLYSEGRKFFLHGELYCALAAAIGKSGARVGDLVRALAPTFPSDAIHEALKRLLDRRYAVAASRSSAGPAAAYWASIGLPPG